MSDVIPGRNLVELKGVSKSYQSGGVPLEILVGVDLAIPAGDSIAVMGRSGSGKSTLLNLIAGLDHVSAGVITVGGRCITDMPEESLTMYRQNTLGLVFQLHYLLKDFTAEENVMLPGLMAGKGRKEAHARAGELLEQVEMLHRREHYPVQMSGGECQRIALARALMNDPDLILADEPTGSLDEKNACIIEEILFDLVDRNNKTLIYVTHNERFSRRGKRRYLLERGNLRA